MTTTNTLSEDQLKIVEPEFYSLSVAPATLNVILQILGQLTATQAQPLIEDLAKQRQDQLEILNPVLAQLRVNRLVQQIQEIQSKFPPLPSAPTLVQPPVAESAQVESTLPAEQAATAATN